MTRGRALWRVAAWAVITVAFAGTSTAVQALVVEPQLLLSRRDLPLPAGRLAEHLAGVTVVHLTDLHMHGMGLRERRLGAAVAAADPALILITGDFAETPDGVAAMRETLGGLKPRLGIFAVPGNNEYQKGESEAIAAGLRAAGVTLLENASRIIQAPGGPVAIAGVDDPHTGRDDIQAALEGIPPGIPVILLTHSTSLLDRKERALMVNPADAQGPWGKGWFWQDGTHVRPDPGDLLFETEGPHTLRVQAREDGVAVNEIRLVPRPGNSRARRWGQRFLIAPRHVEGEIVITPDQVADGDLHGGWRRSPAGLEHTPDAGLLQASALSGPASSFEARFHAGANTRYHLWIHVRSSSLNGSSDSLYAQFSDSLDMSGRPAWRIGVSAPELAEGRVDLILAGHTHGGQVRLPLVGALEPNIRSTPWVDGLYQAAGTWLEVSRGAGWSSLPVRFWCTPQIVVFAGESRDDARTL
jgi:predicted MPP superfamily phosphohydrolase